MKNLKYIIPSFLIVLSMGFVACSERMEIDVKEAPLQLAIYGHITTDTTQHAITVMQSSNYFSNTPPEGISGAIVTISDGDTIVALSENPSEKGVYQTSPDVFGVEGKTYTLKVIAEFNGVTAEYEATSYLPYSVSVDSIALRESDVAGFTNLEALLYGRLPESRNNYLRIRAYKNETLSLNDKLSDFKIIVSENRDVKEIDGVVCMTFSTGSSKSTNIEKDDQITFYVASITKEYADYVQNAQAELVGSIPIFSGPPANVQTNIKAKNASEKAPVCGFFTAYSEGSEKVLWK